MSNEMGLVLETAMSRTAFSGRLHSRIVCVMLDWTSAMFSAISLGDGVSSVVDMYRDCFVVLDLVLVLNRVLLIQEVAGVTNVEMDAVDRLAKWRLWRA